MHKFEETTSLIVSKGLLIQGDSDHSFTFMVQPKKTQTKKTTNRQRRKKSKIETVTSARARYRRRHPARATDARKSCRRDRSSASSQRRHEEGNLQSSTMMDGLFMFKIITLSLFIIIHSPS
jgi:hypothetical protein